MAQVTTPAGMRAFAYETLTVSSTAKVLTAATYAPSNEAAAFAAIVNPADQDIRVTLDGTTPTASVGIRVAAGDQMLVQGQGNVAGLKMIREDGTDSSVGVQYFR